MSVTAANLPTLLHQSANRFPTMVLRNNCCICRATVQYSTILGLKLRHPNPDPRLALSSPRSLPTIHLRTIEYIRAPGRETSQLPLVLILPALSIGNVGQLATDLLISEPSVIKAGYLDDPYVLPCIGNDPIGPTPVGSLTVALEDFEDTKNGLTVVQQRSPVIKLLVIGQGAMVEYAKHLAEWAESVGVKEVLILSGLNSSKRERKEMIDGPQIYYVTNDTNVSIFEQLGWRILEHSEALYHADQLVQGTGFEGDLLADLLRRGG